MSHHSHFVRLPRHPPFSLGGAELHAQLVGLHVLLLGRLPMALRAPRPVVSGSSLWAGIPTVGGSLGGDSARLRKALLASFRFLP